MAAAHIPVLLDEVLELLDPRPGQTALDCTAGRGGHAAAIAERLGPNGTLVLFDLDPGNLAASAERIASLPSPPRVITHNANFAEAPARLLNAGLAADVLLADLGFASSQIEDPERGLSFSREGPLDMRLDPSAPLTAAQLVATLPEQELARIIRDYGEERFAGRIAQRLTQARRSGPIDTTGKLAALIREATGAGRGPPPSIDPATRTFQALRIAVNDELANLQSLLDAIERSARSLAREAAARAWLAPSARVGIISFHSLEDRPVKRMFASLAEKELAESLTRKPVEASDEEVARNPRSRSAKLRALRLAVPDKARTMP